jgi:hypothetical protein
MSNAKTEARKAARADLYGELYNPDDFDTVVDAYEAALEKAGLVLVPREPTEAMLDASGAEDGGEWYFGEKGAAHKAMRQAYRAMIAAAEPK